MQTVLGGILSHIPTSVRNSILADASCEKVCFFGPSSHETISVDELRSPPNVSPPTAVDSKECQLVYDVMRVHHNSVMFERDHIQRIYESCMFAVLPAPLREEARLPFPADSVRQTIHDYIRSHHTTKEDINLKFITWQPPPSSADTLSCADRWQGFLYGFLYALYFVKSFFPPEAWYSEGARIALLYGAQRNTPNAKIFHLPLRSRAKSLQESIGVFEVLLVRDGAEHYLVPEGSRSNYLLVTEDDRLLCSLEKDILRGVTLQAVKRAASTLGLTSVEHRPLYVGDICTAKAIAILGTSLGVLPVREVQLYYDKESEMSFMSALDDYDKADGVKKCPLPLREDIVSGAGKLQFTSASNTILIRLREEYEAEAFR